MVNWQGSNNTTATLTSTSSQVLKGLSGSLKRTQLIITNVGSNVCTITKGVTPAVSSQGIVLNPNTIYCESTDGGYTCWQGELQGISASGTTLAIVESFEDNEREVF